ncbi:MAG TPA: NADPH-dependent 7-cyano-7-deazaguanine reductase QueF [Woeseiaceae bacterium]|nr:NADPH-dependent 7-cyano-7-deazaguanine reductase QueF [Woeseiaceae bacterium]
MLADTPLGRNTPFPDRYAPEVLCALPRRESCEALGVREPLPFRGEDVWNAWELTWLDPRGKPVAATAVFRVPADSPNLVESKSLKLYLNSLAMSRFGSAGEVASIIAGDLSRTAASTVGVDLRVGGGAPAGPFDDLPGDCIDGLEVECDAGDVDASLLACAGGDEVGEELHSHLLRSNCPVTGQPDMGSVLVRYRGTAIDRRGLLRYLVSYRRHCAFHESCVERIFIDLKARCAPEQLTVYARYHRRGGLDINPFRSDFEDRAENVRLWRQ